MREQPSIRAEIFRRKRVREVQRKLDERRPRDAFLSGALACTAIALMVLHIRNTQSIALISEHTAQVEKKLLALRSEKLELELMREQVTQDSKAIKDFLGHCKSVEDIPPFQGQHVITHEENLQHGDNLFFHIPEGEHQLEVTLQTTFKSLGATVGQPAGNKPTETKTWMVPLLAESGYKFELLFPVQTEGLKWRLSSNHPDFIAREEITLVQGSRVTTGPKRLRVGGYGDDDIFYINQPSTQGLLGGRKLKDWKQLAAIPLPRTLLRIRDNYQSDDDQKAITEVTLDIKLRSEGPTTVSARLAADILRLGGENLLMPYEAGGRYELRLQQ